MSGQPSAGKDAPIRHRVFARCGVCGRDVARWEDGNHWWHLDGDVAHDHTVMPPEGYSRTRVMSPGGSDA